MTMKKQNANIKDEIFTEFPHKGERLCDINYITLSVINQLRNPLLIKINPIDNQAVTNYFHF